MNRMIIKKKKYGFSNIFPKFSNIEQIKEHHVFYDYLLLLEKYLYLDIHFIS